MLNFRIPRRCIYVTIQTLSLTSLFSLSHLAQVEAAARLDLLRLLARDVALGGGIVVALKASIAHNIESQAPVSVRCVTQHTVTVQKQHTVTAHSQHSHRHHQGRWVECLVSVRCVTQQRTQQRTLRCRIIELHLGNRRPKQKLKKLTHLPFRIESTFLSHTQQHATARVGWHKAEKYARNVREMCEKWSKTTKLPYEQQHLVLGALGAGLLSSGVGVPEVQFLTHTPSKIAPISAKYNY